MASQDDPEQAADPKRADPTQADPTQAVYRQARFVMPPGAAELLLIRHGESQPAKPGAPFPLVDGHGDPELAPRGRDQAQHLAKRLGGLRIDAIYVSNLRRTAQTAAPLAGRLGLAPQVEPGLREVHLGDWEGGLFRKMVADGHPIAQRMFAEERWDVIPGAEPADAFAARVRATIERIAAAHPHGRVAAFTHGGFIGQALALASRSRRFAFIGADNTSISVLVVAPERWIIRGYNDIAHLESVPDAAPPAPA